MKGGLLLCFEDGAFVGDRFEEGVVIPQTEFAFLDPWGKTSMWEILANLK